MFFPLCIHLWCRSSAVVLAMNHTQLSVPRKANLGLKAVGKRDRGPWGQSE